MILFPGRGQPLGVYGASRLTEILNMPLIGA